MSPRLICCLADRSDRESLLSAAGGDRNMVLCTSPAALVEEVARLPASAVVWGADDGLTREFAQAAIIVGDMRPDLPQIIRTSLTPTAMERLSWLTTRVPITAQLSLRGYDDLRYDVERAAGVVLRGSCEVEILRAVIPLIEDLDALVIVASAVMLGKRKAQVLALAAA
ncbi:MAG: hypothetical protein ACREPM_00050, partial [Gemmatimonadaceae bacterium]